MPEQLDDDGGDGWKTAGHVLHALETYFAGGEVPGNGNREWATFRELPARSGFNPRAIDLFAIGTWQSSKRMLAIEVKVSRGDFQRELADPDKRGAWDEIASEFWFAVPVGLVRIDEVPDPCGLFTVTRDGAVRVSKKPPKRKASPTVPFDFVQGLARRLGDPAPTLPIGSWTLPSGAMVQASDLRRLAERLHAREAERRRVSEERARTQAREQRETRLELGQMRRVLERHFRRHLRNAEELRALLVEHANAGVDTTVRLGLASRLREVADELDPPGTSTSHPDLVLGVHDAR